MVTRQRAANPGPKGETKPISHLTRDWHRSKGCIGSAYVLRETYPSLSVMPHLSAQSLLRRDQLIRRPPVRTGSGTACWSPAAGQGARGNRRPGLLPQGRAGWSRGRCPAAQPRLRTASPVAGDSTGEPTGDFADASQPPPERPWCGTDSRASQPGYQIIAAGFLRLGAMAHPADSLGA